MSSPHPLPTVPRPRKDERGARLWDWLSSKGFSAICPVIRSSSLSDLHEDPFLFYLRIRLGIVPRTRKPNALDTGSLYHHFMQAHGQGEHPRDAIYAQLQEFHDTAEGLADENGRLPHGQPIDKYMNGLEKEAALSYAMGEATLHLIPDKDEWETMHVEKLMSATVQGVNSTCAIRIDNIIADHKAKECWIRDYKSTANAPRLRAMSLPWEFQGRLYRVVTEANAAELELPYPLVGIIHDIIQKPGIRLLKKGTPDEEPWGDYLGRYGQWLLAEGKYAKLKNKRELQGDNPFLRSYVRFWEPAFTPEFVHQLHELDRACTDQPWPERYPRISPLNFYNNAPSDYAPFYATEPRLWPGLMKDRFHTVHRDWRELQDIL